MTADKQATTQDSEIGIVDAGLRSTITADDFHKRFGVDGWIRMQEADFEEMLALPSILTHFNLGTTSNEAGKRYALIAIETPGSVSSDGDEEVPYVDVGRIRKSVCLEVRQSVPLSDTDFAESLPSIKTSEALSAALIDRYSRIYPTLSDSELLEKGCAVTVLRLEELQKLSRD